MEEIQTDRAVTIRYVMRTCYKDGTVKERPKETLSFIYGVERQVSSLEKALEGCAIGRTLTVDIPSTEIYGDHDPSLVREIPKQGLIKQRLREGQYYRQMKMGSLISFKVIEVREKTVLADFNKPLAGISVAMDLEVLDIRHASKEEIENAIEAQVKRSIGCG